MKKKNRLTTFHHVELECTKLQVITPDYKWAEYIINNVAYLIAAINEQPITPMWLHTNKKYPHY